MSFDRSHDKVKYGSIQCAILRASDILTSSLVFITIVIVVVVVVIVVVIVVIVVVVFTLSLSLAAAEESAIVTAWNPIFLKLFYNILQQAPLLIRKANGPAFKRFLTPDTVYPPAEAQVTVTDRPILDHRCLLAFAAKRCTGRAR